MSTCKWGSSPTRTSQHWKNQWNEVQIRFSYYFRVHPEASDDLHLYQPRQPHQGSTTLGWRKSRSPTATSSDWRSVKSWSWETSTLQDLPRCRLPTYRATKDNFDASWGPSTVATYIQGYKGQFWCILGTSHAVGCQHTGLQKIILMHLGDLPLWQPTYRATKDNFDASWGPPTL